MMVIADSLIEFLDQLRLHHGKVGTEGWINHLDKQRLVADKLLARITSRHQMVRKKEISNIGLVNKVVM